MIKRIDDEKFYFPDVAGHVVEYGVCRVGFCQGGGSNGIVV